jgi:hypothetical protein
VSQTFLVDNSTISNVNTTPVTETNNSTNFTATVKRTKEYYKFPDNSETSKIKVTEEFSASYNKNSNNSSIDSIFKESLGLFTQKFRSSNESLNLNNFRDSLATNNDHNFVGSEFLNQSLDNITRSKNPSNSTLDSNKKLRLDINFNKSEAMIGTSTISPTSPSTTILPSTIVSPTTISNTITPIKTNFNINKELPRIPSENLDNNKLTTKKSYVIKKMKSLPFLNRNTYNANLISYLDFH